MSKVAGPPRTPDGRYIVVIGRSGPRLWRASNPGLAPEEQARLTGELMSARRAIRSAKGEDLVEARARVNAAKIALGERGPIWWSDGAPDLNRRLIEGTCYAQWWAAREPH